MKKHFIILAIVALLFLISCESPLDIETFSVIYFGFTPNHNPKLSQSYKGKIENTQITIYISDETDLSALRPKIVHNATSIEPESLEPRDFSLPQSYTLQTPDGQLKEYRITVIKGLPPVQDPTEGPSESPVATPTATPTVTATATPTSTPTASPLPVIEDFSGHVVLGDDNSAYFFKDIELLTEYDSFEIHNSLSQRDIAYGSGVLVSVGADGSISYSSTTNALLDNQLNIEWNNLIIGSANYNAITYGPEGFIAVGDGGVVIYSVNGQNWNTADSGTSAQLSDVQFIDNYYVAVGNQGTMIYSEDGENWNSNQAAGNIQFYGISGTPYNFIAVANNGTIWTRNNPDSPWSEANSTVPNGAHLLATSFSNGQSIAIGTAGLILYSNYINYYTNWFDSSASTSAKLTDAIAYNNKFLIVGDNGTIITGVPGYWTINTPAGLPSLSSVVYIP